MEWAIGPPKISRNGRGLDEACRQRRRLRGFVLSTTCERKREAIEAPTDNAQRKTLHKRCSRKKKLKQAAETGYSQGCETSSMPAGSSSCRTRDPREQPPLTQKSRLISGDKHGP